MPIPPSFASSLNDLGHCCQLKQIGTVPTSGAGGGPAAVGGAGRPGLTGRPAVRHAGGEWRAQLAQERLGGRLADGDATLGHGLDQLGRGQGVGVGPLVEDGRGDHVRGLAAAGRRVVVALGRRHGLTEGVGRCPPGAPRPRRTAGAAPPPSARPGRAASAGRRRSRGRCRVRRGRRMASTWSRARGAAMAASWAASASTWSRVARRVVARRSTIISSSTPSTRAAGGIRATPRAAQVGSAWATLSTKLTPAAAASSSSATTPPTRRDAPWWW